MKQLIITNNPKVYAEFFADGNATKGPVEVDFREGASQEEILLRARDLIHLGGKLIIHPMMGRIKPHETPYKSVYMEVPEDNDRNSSAFETDAMSVMIIEDSLSETRKLLNDTYGLKYDESLLPDLQHLDYLLIRSGIEECR